MIEARLDVVEGRVHTRVGGEKCHPVEAAVLIAAICSRIEAHCPEYTAERILEDAAYALALMREEKEQGGGLKVKCHLDADGCEELKDGAWCSRFGCDCAEIHCDEEMEDE